MGLENGMRWINFQNFANDVGVTPQCSICKYKVINSFTGILCPCYLFSMNIGKHVSIIMINGSNKQ